MAIPLFVLAVLASGIACERAGPVGPGGDRVRVFLQEQPILGDWLADTVAVDAPSGATIFAVYHGSPTVISFGLAFQDRVGWLLLPEGGTESRLFDIRPDDTALFDLLLRETLSGLASTAYRLRLASDPDTHEDGLVFIASSLATDPSGLAIGRALIGNPTVRQSREALEELAKVSLRRGTDWSDVHASAWEALANLQETTIEDLVVGGTPQFGGDGISGVARFQNPGSESLLIEFAAVCHTTLLVYDNPAYGGEPRWDQLALYNSRPGGCKWLPEQRRIEPGGVLELVTAPAGVGEILGDSLPSGRYHLAVRVRFIQPADTTYIVPLGPLELPASVFGTVMTSDSLPAAGVTVRATPSDTCGTTREGEQSLVTDSTGIYAFSFELLSGSFACVDLTASRQDGSRVHLPGYEIPGGVRESPVHADLLLVPPVPARDDSPLQTDHLQYTLTGSDAAGWSAEVVVRYENRAPETVYLPGCHPDRRGNPLYGFQRAAPDTGRVIFSLAFPCVGGVPALAIPPDAVRTDTVQFVSLVSPAATPRQHPRERIGLMRIRYEVYGGVTETGEADWQTLLPEVERQSNVIEIRYPE